LLAMVRSAERDTLSEAFHGDRRADQPGVQGPACQTIETWGEKVDAGSPND